MTRYAHVVAAFLADTCPREVLLLVDAGSVLANRWRADICRRLESANQTKLLIWSFEIDAALECGTWQKEDFCMIWAISWSKIK
jgi:hypothetical protein